MLSRDHARLREEALRHPALTDPRTGLASRLHFELVFSYLFSAGDRGMAFTLMLVSAGAASDDEVRAVGEAMARVTRSSDLVSYVGEGRYLLLLLATNLQGARITADRIEVALAGVAPKRPALGLAAYAGHMEESTELLDAAERALAAAEAAGGGVELA